ncbi:MAG: helix-turn-helix transcriptional regulator [Crocinitomicaceae bacterium]|nr:helix-turn-helix transcriptional regulator [Crocinitomicaceae bacterium]MCF8433292.1 helix-turn-helix transcriptional regulator [Crocinitomicaceae bacterium]
MKKDQLSKSQIDALMFVSERLKALRIAKGYTNYEYLAYEIGMSRSQLGTYENGANITIATLVKILDHLGVTLEEFFKSQQQ